jgi:hypothetical protein
MVGCLMLKRRTNQYIISNNHLESEENDKKTKSFFIAFYFSIPFSEKNNLHRSVKEVFNEILYKA